MLAVRGICKRFGEKTVLNGVDLCVEPGRCVCLAGGNAEGKTTLLKIAAGVLRPEAGTVEQDGTVGYAPQSCELMTDLSVRDNLLLWYAACGRSGKKLFAPGSTEEELGLSAVKNKRVSRLSGGYQKRVTIAAGAAGGPRYFLLDEPFAPLDVGSRDDVLSLLGRFVQAGGGVLFSSHDPAIVARLADEVHFLQSGRITDVLHLGRTDAPEERARSVLDAFYRAGGQRPLESRE